MRLIDADKLKEECFVVDSPNSWSFRGVSEDDIGDCPTVDAEPVVHAHWETGYFRDRVCSHCTHPANNLNEHPFLYCPWCGAKMDEVITDEKE